MSIDLQHLKYRATRGSPPVDSGHRLGQILGLSLAFLVLAAQPGNAAEWEVLDKTADGIQIFRKEAKGSGLIAFRGIGVVDAPLPVVATVLFDTDRRREWIEGLVDSRIIRWKDKETFIEYDHIGTPFFLADRDFISEVRMTFDLTKKQLVFHYESSDDPSAPYTDYLRGEVIDITFILTSIDSDRKTKLDAAFLCDPKGWIPKWIVNYFLKDWPKTTFRSLRREVLKSDRPIDAHFFELLKSGPSNS